MKVIQGVAAILKCGLLAAASIAVANASSVSVQVSKSSIAENGGSIKVTLHNHEDAAVSYSYWTVNGTATGGSDFQAVNGRIRVPMLGTASFYVPVYNDSAVEGNETFQVCAGWAVGTLEDCASVTIVDDDANVSFSIADASAVESDGSITFAVTRTGNDHVSHSVNFATANGTASSTSDYVAKSGTLTFTATGASTQYITVSLRNNIMPENVESFYVNLSGLTNGGTLSDAQGRGTVFDDDEEPCGGNGTLCP